MVRRLWVAPPSPPSLSSGAVGWQVNPNGSLMVQCVLMVRWQEGRQIDEQVRRGGVGGVFGGVKERFCPRGQWEWNGLHRAVGTALIPELKQCLDNALRHRVSILSDPTCSQELGFDGPCGSRYPKWGYSVIL